MAAQCAVDPAAAIQARRVWEVVVCMAPRAQPCGQADPQRRGTVERLAVTERAAAVRLPLTLGAAKNIMLLSAMALVNSYRLTKLLLSLCSAALRVATSNRWRAPARASSAVPAKFASLRNQLHGAVRGAALSKCAASVYAAHCPTVRSIRPAPSCRLEVKCKFQFINRLPLPVSAGGLA